MSDFSVRSDNVDVEQIMRQIRARIREKRGVDYTEEEIRELANVKLEKFLDPRGVRSDLLEQFRRTRAAMPAPPNFAFVTRKPPPGYCVSSTYSIVAPSQNGWLCESMATGIPAASSTLPVADTRAA